MKERINMVEKQIIGRGVKDEKVLNAMKTVERHLFVPEEHRYTAYEDMPIPIGMGQTISQPYIVAFMTELLELRGDEKVLEIGTGSGYQAAVLAGLCKEVYSIEIIPELGQRAKNTLAGLGYKNIRIRIGDGYRGWKEFAPFDAIIVTCAPNDIPAPLVEQLAEGGKMVIPVGDFVQELILAVKEGGKIRTQRVLDVRFVPMVRSERE